MVNYKLLQQVKVVNTDNLATTLVDILHHEGYQHPLIVMDSFLAEFDVIKKVQKKFTKKGIEFNVFDQIVPDPATEVVDEGVKTFENSKADSIIAIGGGSSIDVARGINIVRINGGNIMDYAKEKRNIKRSLGLIAVPTTSGTGSEMSNALVLTDKKTKQKMAILSDNAVSEYAVLNPDLLLTLPPKMTIATGLDAFSHAAEGYLSRLSTPMTDAICEKVMFLIYNYLPVAVRNGKDREAREKVMVAASLAGWMLNNAGTNIGHSTAHILGSKYHIVHGEAVAYALPGVLKLVGQSMPKKVREIGKILGATFTEEPSPENTTNIAIKAYKDFRDDILGLHPFSDYGLTTKEIKSNIEEILNERFAINTPVDLTYKNVSDFLDEYGR
ncbi:iron-containing alcohol dehydrogenase [Pediococcus acidilactici]|nr:MULTISPECIES: iron-containing alcohol dehydrogenase [Pediococcus]KAF0367770.1 iron-containing alcohol dehydrogenase [Pediococcus acidilactici]KAF0518368.1 iron-containing alcohol dehydrogenase [Pediococcus acidilactici]KSV56688.1 alcohol dehydrogenase [Pediococcus acidilactici]MCT3036744.1 iron-containing alcohol dehydrogenase [Pediococcus acidilactici]QAT21258.1 iron-containing alcohol dehydrogenase [Pediococcus acidilactici]